VLRTTRLGGSVLDMEHAEYVTRIAEKVRFLAAQQGLERIDIQRALRIDNRRYIERRWNGEYPYSVPELAVIGDLLGVRVVDLLNQDDEPT
jgi:transcriptional regulator with XRE-family HTH domain